MVFQMYKSGVLDSASCGTNLDHAVLAVGFEADPEGSLPYYYVKNSWGPVWGDEGFIKIAIEDGAGICGIQEDSLYPATD
mmetsp:Transcript_3653/g.5504  ORF Transcript_3653/g.5504 Transcript_3653/m.5504 type:complete len:80 (+) Transcript_3653:764-1003(+)